MKVQRGVVAVLFITPLERDALRLVARNGTTAEVAACLGIEAADVAMHLADLFSRMGMSSRSEALACAGRRGLLEADGMSVRTA